MCGQEVRWSAACPLFLSCAVTFSKVALELKPHFQNYLGKSFTFTPHMSNFMRRSRIRFPLSCSSTSKGGAKRPAPGLINTPRLSRAKPVRKMLGFTAAELPLHLAFLQSEAAAAQAGAGPLRCWTQLMVSQADTTPPHSRLLFAAQTARRRLPGIHGWSGHRTWVNTAPARRPFFSQSPASSW